MLSSRASVRRRAGQPDHEALCFWREKKEELFQRQTRVPLKTINWQLRAMLYPGSDCVHVLTTMQDRVYRSTCREPCVIKEGKTAPARIRSGSKAPGLDSAGRAVRFKYAALANLLDMPSTPSAPPSSMGSPASRSPGPSRSEASPAQPSQSSNHGTVASSTPAPSSLRSALPHDRSRPASAATPSGGATTQTVPNGMAQRPASTLQYNPFAGIICTPSKRRTSPELARLHSCRNCRHCCLVLVDEPRLAPGKQASSLPLPRSFLRHRRW